MASGPIRKRFQVLHSPGEAEAPLPNREVSENKGDLFRGLLLRPAHRPGYPGPGRGSGSGVEEWLILGELSLDGRVRPIRGRLFAAIVGGTAENSVIEVKRQNGISCPDISALDSKPVCGCVMLEPPQSPAQRK